MAPTIRLGRRFTAWLGILACGCGAAQPAPVAPPATATTPPTVDAAVASAADDVAVGATTAPDPASMDAAAVADATTPDVVTLSVSVDVTATGTATATGRSDAAVPRPATRDPSAGSTTAPTPPPPLPPTGGVTLAAGRPVFDRACGRCHPGGNEDTGPRIVGIAWTEPRMRGQIRNGSGRMRAISQTRLPDASLPALMAYLRTLRAVR